MRSCAGWPACGSRGSTASGSGARWQMPEGRIGVIGGSGLYELEGLADVRWEEVRTPFGEPSAAYCLGRLGAREMVFLPRHGRGHRLLPPGLNYPPNAYGLKAPGAQWVLSLTP